VLKRAMSAPVAFLMGSSEFLDVGPPGATVQRRIHHELMIWYG
jgi:hypothetical protein